MKKIITIILLLMMNHLWAFDLSAYITNGDFGTDNTEYYKELAFDAIQLYTAQRDTPFTAVLQAGIKIRLMDVSEDDRIDVFALRCYISGYIQGVINNPKK